MKTLQQWLEEMDKLDLEAAKWPWVYDGVAIFTEENNSSLVVGSDGGGFNRDGDSDSKCVACIELPRAIRVIRYLRNRLIVAESRLEYEMCVASNINWTETIDRGIEKILNEEVG